MFDLHLSAEQLEIRDTVRDFVARKVKPVALAPVRLEPFEKPLLTALLDQASRMGLRTLSLPEERGGAGADNLTSCIVTEELAVGDPDIAAVLAQTAMLGRLLERLMTPAQRDRFLPQFVGDDRFQLAFAEHEPGRETALGVHYHRPAARWSSKTAAYRRKISSARRDAARSRTAPKRRAAAARSSRRSIWASAAPRTRPRSTTRSCACRAAGASSSIRRSARSSPGSRSGSRSRAPRSGARHGRRIIPMRSPTAAFPSCRCRRSPGSSPRRP